MKARIPFKARNPTGAAAMNAEIRRQCVELNAEYELELDALVLWTLHESSSTRWGCMRLMRFYEDMLANRKKMHDFYSGDKPDKSDTGIEYFAATQKLREIGFDLEAVYRTLKIKYDV